MLQGTERAAMPAQVNPLGKLVTSDLFLDVIAILIVVGSVMSAVVGWQASRSSSHASDLDQAATQQRAQQQQILAANEGKVDQDLRLLSQFQEHVKAWRLLQEEANNVRDSDSTLADQLDSEAQGELALARSLNPYFLAQIPGYGNDQGDVTYDRESALEFLNSTDPELAALRPAAFEAMAAGAHTKTVRLVGVAAMFILSLFFLTVAQVARASLRLPFAAAGVAVMGVGAILFVLAEVL